MGNPGAGLLTCAEQEGADWLTGGLPFLGEPSIETVKFRVDEEGRSMNDSILSLIWLF